MATNKNQHFVPRCYLKAFTVHGENRAINVYNIDHDRYISGAPVKNQCSGDYFYGQDQGLEDAIQFVEGSYAREATQLISGCTCLSEEAATALRAFWVLQHLRTEAASRRSAEMSLQMADAVGEEIDGFAMSIKQAVQIAMHAYVEMFRATEDLEICIVRNISCIPFITSDDPAVMTNRWHFHRQWHITRSFGLGSAGMIGVLPLSEQLLCVLYDPDLYELAHNGRFLETALDSDAEFLNELQILNCHANLYVRGTDERAIRKTVEFVRPRRVYPRTQVTYAIRDVDDGDYTRYRVVPSKDSEPHQEALIHSRQLYAEPSGWPAFLRWRNRGLFFIPKDTSMRRQR
ncbi:DUF4238 domain-containing protein [Lysobacter capsici]|jgi:hypothetical protein|uniref:DUF4238 domain-containing protein n=1 Tax=Lysobacter capsici TaxID=435897 RepID=UPI0009E91C25|nr:DUF4238 domain-containing protein [Lysobacter capsici]WND83103.1 DUF4238 domain-containing protein [Lysobacter capsici]WND88302.1 DUF4238 domain-containing protein [Lysobacter capsici]